MYVVNNNLEIGFREDSELTLWDVDKLVDPHGSRCFVTYSEAQQHVLDECLDQIAKHTYIMQAVG